MSHSKNRKEVLDNSQKKIVEKEHLMFYRKLKVNVYDWGKVRKGVDMVLENKKNF